MDSLSFYDQNLYVYPEAGEASTALVRRTNDIQRCRTYESNIAKQKISRAATKMRRYIKCNHLKLMVTLTYESESDWETISKDSSLWIRRIRSNLYQGSLPYIKVIEGIPDTERLHIHTALPGCDYRKMMNSWSKGRVKIIEFGIDESEIIAKYLAKSIAIDELAAKRSHSTGNLFAPKRLVIPIGSDPPKTILENKLKTKELRCMEEDYGYAGGGRFEFIPFKLEET